MSTPTPDLSISSGSTRAWSSAWAVAVLVVALAIPARAQQRPVPFQRFADEFLRSHGLADTDPKDIVLRDVLDRQYSRIRLGRLDVRCPPRWFATKTGRRRLREVVTALLALEQTWAETTTGAPVSADAAKAVARLRRWVASWSDARLHEISGEPAGDLLEAMEPGPDQQDAWARLRGGLLSDGEGDGAAPGARSPALIVLSPDRQHFLELTGYLGTIDAQNRAIFWQDNMPLRSQCWVPFPLEMQIVALEYAHPDQKGDDFTTGFDMNAREKTGLQQHVVQCAAASLTHEAFSGRVDASVEAGLIHGLTIAVCGENNARFGGDGKGRSAGGQGGFVAGGRSQGGGMVAPNMDSSWRVMKGRFYFVKALASARRKGAKRAKGLQWKHACFQLVNRKETETHVVQAPFLGAPAEKQAQLPADFVDDFKEFHRAYRTAFVFWLQNHAAKSKRASRERFGELLRRRADPAAEQIPFDDTCRELYGAVLSASGPEPPSLEWRFLAWLHEKS